MRPVSLSINVIYRSTGKSRGKPLQKIEDAENRSDKQERSHA